MIYIDGHVHIWQKYDLKSFFNCAFLNFSVAASKNRHPEKALFVLLLAETLDDCCYSKLVSMAERKEALSGPGNLIRLEVIDEMDAISIAHSEFPNKMLLVPGQQIVTAENIEILGLFMKSKIHQSLSLKKVVEEIHKYQGLAVIPWGVGKWIGQRGKLIDTYLAQLEDKMSGLMIGDNGNRPWCWPKSSIIRFADKYKLGVLAGSDPLSIPKGSDRVGCFGTMLDIPEPKNNLLHLIRKALEGHSSHLHPYGSPQEIYAFFRSQIALRRS